MKSTRPTRRVGAAITVALVGIAALSGCSQVKGLAVQGNMNVIYLETAASDVLLSQNVAIEKKPVCTVNDSADYSCIGTAAGGVPITVTVPDSSGDPIMIITLGGKQVFSGSVLDVIEANSQATP